MASTVAELRKMLEGLPDDLPVIRYDEEPTIGAAWVGEYYLSPVWDSTRHRLISRKKPVVFLAAERPVEDTDDTDTTPFISVKHLLFAARSGELARRIDAAREEDKEVQVG